MNSQHSWDTGNDLHLLPIFTETPVITGGGELENVNQFKLVNLCKIRWVARIDAHEAN